MGWPVTVTTNAGRMVMQPTAKCYVGGSNPGRSTVVGGAAAMFARPGFNPSTKKSAVSCITIRPLLAVSQMFSPLLGAASATGKNPNCVFLSN